MKFRILLPLLLFLFSTAFAQQVRLDAGLGVGTTFHDGSIGPGKVLFTSALTYEYTSRFEFGVDFLTTGQMRFSDPEPILELSNFDIYESGLANMTNYMAFGRYKFPLREPRRHVFVGAGLGLSHVVQRVNTNETKSVSKNNFIIGLEAGIVRNNWTLGLRWISPVTTPAFEEVNQETGRTVVFSEANLTPVFFYAKYDLIRIGRN
jgi:hypothetical protein